MNCTVVLSLLFLFCIPFYSVAQEVKWALRAGYYAFDYGHGITGDAEGNVYITGKFEMNSFFDDNTRVEVTGNHDIFTAKYDPGGQLQWVRTAGGLFGDYGHDVASDGRGNIYVTGEIDNTVYFYDGDDSLRLSSWGRNDIFIAKYRSNGDLVWAKRAGGSGSDKAYSIAATDESIYITGSFEDTAWFEDKSIPTAGDYDVFVAGYDTSGNLKWVRRGGGMEKDRAYGITVDSGGYIYTTGIFEDEGDFSSNHYTTNGGRDCFITKYDPDGNLIWLKTAGGSGTDEGKAIKAGKDGRIYVTGEFKSKAHFGDTIISSQGSADIFTACYTSDGDAVWVKSAGGDETDQGNGIAIDDSLNIYVTGNFGLIADFEDSTFTSPDNADIFIMSYNKDGNRRWALHVNGRQDAIYESGTEESGRDIWVDKYGNVFVTGSYRTDAVFGDIRLAGWQHTDIFLTKIQQYDYIMDPPASIIEHSLKRYFSIFPNPAQDALYIKYTGENELNVQVEIISILGNTVLEEIWKISGNSTKHINLGKMATGTYLISMSTEEGKFGEKLFIQE